MSDITFIHTKCRSYLFQDLLQKPSELVMFRPVDEGGLGLQHVKCKALAHLISVFLQTAANPQYISSQFHTALFKSWGNSRASPARASRPITTRSSSAS